MGRRKTSRLLLAAALVAALGAGVASVASGTTASNLALITIGNDTIRNYDFHSQTVSATNVDWAVDLIFSNNATINKVKSALDNPYDQGATCASPQYGRLDDGAGFVWDEDSGKKTTCCPITGSDYHFRIYADSDDRLGYNPTYGYWVFGTTHKDVKECGTGTWYGDSEVAEQYMRSVKPATWGMTAEAINLQNYEAPRWDGDHYWNNSGYATVFSVP
jgi:spermidine/putrescine-binding protein